MHLAKHEPGANHDRDRKAKGDQDPEPVPNQTLSAGRGFGVLPVQGGRLSGPTALPASFSGIIMISYESSVYTAITPLKVAGSAVGPLRLPPCTLSQVRHSSRGIRLVVPRDASMVD